MAASAVIREMCDGAVSRFAQYLDAKKEVGMLWQDLLLVEELNVGQNVNSGALGRHNLIWGLANLLFNIDQPACRDCLQRAGLDADLIDGGLIDAPIRQLSGGKGKEWPLRVCSDNNRN